MVQLASGKHRLAVGQKGRMVALREVTLQRGQTQNIRVTLEQTPQRITSQFMFVAGGAIARREPRTQRICHSSRGRRRTVSAPPAGSEREPGGVDQLQDGDQRRAIAFGSFDWRVTRGVSRLFHHGACSCTSSISPILSCLYRTAPRPGAEPPPPPAAPKARVQVAPIFYANGLGAMLGGSF